MFGRMKTGTKILAAFGLAIAATLTVSAIGWWSNARVTAKLNVLADEKMATATALAQLQEGQAQVARSLNTLLLRRADADMRRDARANIERFIHVIDESWSAYEAIPHGERSRKLYADLQGPWAEWRRTVDRLVSVMDER